MEASLNGDLTRRVDVDSTTLEWRASPSGSVDRRRLHRVGPREAGQVTSVVRYQAGARFPAHPHPEGEEILVLEGVFSDEGGDWPEGSYLLNPEGFRHAPYSHEGCLLFVKLRQYPGEQRSHVALASGDLPWEPTADRGRRVKWLYRDAAFADQMRLEHWSTGTGALPDFRYPEGAEIFVVSGHFDDDLGRHAVGSWVRLPPGSRHRVQAAADARVYVKVGGIHYLRSGDAAP